MLTVVIGGVNILGYRKWIQKNFASSVLLITLKVFEFKKVLSDNWSILFVSPP